jgi:nitrite reductase (NADH) large subunit
VLECDTLVVATGIKPTTQLALEAGISVGRGIRVDDQMRTSDPHVYAVGECAEHRGQVYGLAAPGLEQAGVAAHVIAGGEASYQGSLAATRLKVVGLPVFSMGRTGADEPPAQLTARIFEAGDGRAYRKLLLERGRLVGAIAVGEWPDLGRVQEAITRRRRLWPWQLGRFGRTGSPWPESEGREVSQWPASATVCNCTGVTRGRLSEAMSEGQSSIAALAACTGASTVCGSCKPLLAELVGSSEPVPAEPGRRGLMVAGVLSLLAALAFLLAPPIPYPDSVQVSLRWDALWRDGLLKQITGFGLLGLGALISLISLRKRLPRFSLGAFSAWRTVHVVLGVLVAALLVAHTGLRLGHNLNLLLMLSFVGLLLVGAAASGVIGLQHRLPRRFAARSRSISLWLHILLLWPLPALLGFHVLKTYWY